MRGTDQRIPKRGGMAPVKDVLATWIKTSGLAGKFRDAQVFRAWRAAAGPNLTTRAVPVRFESGELTIEVRSAAHMHELQNFTGEQFRRAANQRLGAERITRVVFRLAR